MSRSRKDGKDLKKQSRKKLLEGWKEARTRRGRITAVELRKNKGKSGDEKVAQRKTASLLEDSKLPLKVHEGCAKEDERDVNEASASATGVAERF